MFDFKNITSQLSVVISVSDPSSIAFLNVYEEGDIWIKIEGCEKCSYENRTQCCGSCPMNTEKGCFFHLDKRSNINKPFYCIASPTPKDCIGYCSQKFKCLQGKYRDKIRKISKPSDIFE